MTKNRATDQHNPSPLPKIGQAGEGTQVVPVTWKELNNLNDETGDASYYARSPHKKRLMAVMSRVVKFFEEEHAEIFDCDVHRGAFS